jgi:hypothetical protein
MGSQFKSHTTTGDKKWTKWSAGGAGVSNSNDLKATDEIEKLTTTNNKNNNNNFTTTPPHNTLSQWLTLSLTLSTGLNYFTESSKEMT